MFENFEKQVFQEANRLLKQSRQNRSSFFKKNWWYQNLLSWTMDNQALKTSLFRFIDVLPSLPNDEAFLSHWNEYFKDQNLNFMTSHLGRLAPSLTVKAIKKQILQVAQMFITGSDTKSVLNKISQNWNHNLAFSIDILGEETLSEKEAEFYFKSYLNLMEDLLKAQKNWSYKKQLQTDSLGEIPAINISVKASSLFSQTKLPAWEYSKSQIKNRLRPLFQKAVQDFLFINLDMEHYDHKDLYYEIFKELLMEEDLKNYPHFGIVLQAYLRDSFKDLKQLVRFSHKRGQKFSVRLVKGAYWDSEYLLARQKNWPVPVYTNKQETDANYERALEYLFKESSALKIAVASHNIRSIACALAHHEKYPEAQLEFQFLYGMAEDLALSLSEKGHLVRLYCTLGDWIPGMSYLVRRLLENSANQSFILKAFMKNEPVEKLLSPPQIDEKLLDQADALENSSKIKAPAKKTSFSNYPLPDFSKKEQRESFYKALKDWETKFPIEVPFFLKGKALSSQGKNSPDEISFKRENPSNPKQIISNVYFVKEEDLKQASSNCLSFFEKWKASPIDKRILSLRKTAMLIQKDFFRLASLQVFEVGKTWEEACGDVAEAIDFCVYYADSYEKLIKPKLTDQVSGEDSFLCYEAIGPTAVIAPWNFPLAILVGMTVAPLVCGNTVLIKPAEQSSLTAFEFVKILIKAGFPPESFAFVPGKGETAGEYLVQQADIPIVSFTGSFEVGKKIIEKTKTLSENQKEFKKCIVEMGGKNAIVIDSSADLDEAVRGCLQSAFGFQGQKCSACSRIIILESIYDKFMARFLPAVESLVVGPSEHAKSSLGPLVSAQAFEKTKDIIKNRINCELLFPSSLEEISFNNDQGFFISPVIYLCLDSKAFLMQEELFAPVVACYKAKDLKSAIQALNQTKFGLTAGFYSRHPGHIKLFSSLAEVGNIYINRNCTGALVKRHPFGGRKASGLGSKTGGEDYLKQFLHSKVVTENKMRRGFSPEIFKDTEN